jgi:3',5'-nucleoside bisphosphate phosphatase
VLSVTDHDTTAGLPEAAAAASGAGLTFVTGIEVTAVEQATDVHLLGYFFDPASRELADLLAAQLADRHRRVADICRRLDDLGYGVDLPDLDRPGAEGHRPVGRPAVARALVGAGHTSSIREAFERFLAPGRPAFVERRGVSPADVVSVVTRAGGLCSLAHPGLLDRDGWIRSFVDGGLAAIEVFHGDHGPADEARYAAVAAEYGLAQTGGSDFHGDDAGRARCLGSIGLPVWAFANLVDRAVRFGCARVPRWA